MSTSEARRKIYLEATELGICWSCKGKKGFTRKADYDNMGIWQESHYVPCSECGDTGKPSEDQLLKTGREERDVCPTCALDKGLERHRGQDFPYGCLRAAIAEIHILKDKIRTMDLEMRR